MRGREIEDGRGGNFPESLGANWEERACIWVGRLFKTI